MAPTFSHFFVPGGSHETHGRWSKPHNWDWNNWGRNVHGHGFGHDRFPVILPPIRPVTPRPKFSSDLQIVGISVFFVAILIAFILLICKICCVLCTCCRKSDVIYVREVGDVEETSQNDECRPRQSRQRTRRSMDRAAEVLEQQISFDSAETFVTDPIPSAPVLSPNSDSQPPPFDPPPTYGEAVLQSQYGTNHTIELHGKCP